LVTTTRSITESVSRCAAGPENSGWVASAMTRAAPRSLSSSAAPQMVPAVSIMSSTRMAVLPSTSPMTSRVTLTFCCSGSRRLCRIAMVDPTWPANFSVRRTRPASGETMTRSSGEVFSLTHSTSSGSAVSASNGSS
jgi:hypothetical protein